MFDTLKAKLQAVLASIEAAAGTDNLVDAIGVVQAATNEYFEVAKKIAANLNMAGPGDDAAKAECRELCDRIAAACRAKAGPRGAGVGAVDWGKLFQLIQTLISIIGPLLA